MAPRPRSGSRGGRRGDRGGQGRSEAYDEERFTSRSNQDWYNSHRNNGIIVEKSLAESIDEHFEITPTLDTFNWSVILHLPTRYYPSLVREFYANIEHKASAGSGELVSFVKGVPITLTRDYLSHLLGTPNVGPSFITRRDDIVSDPNFELNPARLALNLGHTARGTGRTALLTRALSIKNRILIHILSHNLAPRSSSLNEVRTVDIYLLHKLLFGLGDTEGIPLASIILHYMAEVARSCRPTKTMCFPRLLSRIFEDFGVDYTGEVLCNVGNAETINETTLSNFGFERRNEGWVRRGAPEERGEPERGAPMPEGGDERRASMPERENIERALIIREIEQEASSQSTAHSGSAASGPSRPCRCESRLMAMLRRTQEMICGVQETQQAIQRQLTQ